MVAARVEPNSVFSATDNAVMDPEYGLDIATLIKCIEGKALDHKQQVTLSLSLSLSFALASRRARNLLSLSRLSKGS